MELPQNPRAEAPEGEHHVRIDVVLPGGHTETISRRTTAPDDLRMIRRLIRSCAAELDQRIANDYTQPTP